RWLRSRRSCGRPRPSPRSARPCTCRGHAKSGARVTFRYTTSRAWGAPCERLAGGLNRRDPGAARVRTCPEKPRDRFAGGLGGVTPPMVDDHEIAAAFWRRAPGRGESRPATLAEPARGDVGVG